MFYIEKLQKLLDIPDSFLLSRRICFGTGGGQSVEALEPGLHSLGQLSTANSLLTFTSWHCT
jgi:hypothetical protein